MTRPDDFHNFAELDDAVARELAPGVATRVVAGDQAMFSVVSFEPNAAGSMHSHPEEQWGVVLEGSGVRTQDGVAVPVAVGTGDEVVLDPAGRPPEVTDGAKVLDVFAPPREAYRTSGSGFAAG